MVKKYQDYHHLKSQFKSLQERSQMCMLNLMMETFFAIEVVYTHPPTEEVHNLYGENMVDIRLKELAVIEDDEVFGDWIQHNGVQILLEKESEILQRKKTI